MDAMDSTDQHAAHAAHEAMSGSLSMDPHLVLTPVRPRSPADSTRAAQLVAQMRAALVRYHDVHAAEADGFRKFLPGVKQPIYHFTSWRWALRATRRFDPTRPTSLLYREGPRGTSSGAGRPITSTGDATTVRPSLGPPRGGDIAAALAAAGPALFAGLLRTGRVSSRDALACVPAPESSFFTLLADLRKRAQHSGR